MKAIQQVNDDLEILFLSPSEYATVEFADTGQPLAELYPEGIAVKMDRHTGAVISIDELAIAEMEENHGTNTA